MKKLKDRLEEKRKAKGVVTEAAYNLCIEEFLDELAGKIDRLEDFANDVSTMPEYQNRI